MAARPIEKSQVFWSLVVALGIAGGVYWYSLPDSKGPGGGLDSGFQLYLGFIILGLVAAVMLFSLRKWGLFFYFAYFLQPRPGMEEYIDKATFQLRSLQRQVDNGIVTNVRDVRERAQKILETTGVSRSFALRYKTKSVGERRVPEIEMYRKEPFGRLFRYFEIHIFFGTLAFALTLIHADFSWWSAGMISRITMLLLGGTMLTGFVGIYIYFFVPGRLARTETEITYGESRKQLEKIEDELGVIVRNGGDAVKRAFGPYTRGLVAGKKVDLAQVQAAATSVAATDREAFDQGIIMLGQAEKLERYYTPQHAQKRKLTIWLWLHVPLAIAMIVFMIVHAVSVWYY